MLRQAGLAAVLFAFWLLLSGHYTGFLISVGLITSVAVTVALHSFTVVDEQAQPFEFLVGALTYWPWLAWEIFKSGWRVTRIILDPKLPISPTMRQVKSSQKTAVGRVTYANSITLTPGTISVALEGDKVLVHALEASSLDDLDEGTMDSRVTVFEGGQIVFTVAACAVVVALVLAVVRALKGPTVFDRLLAGNAIGTGAILLLAVFGFLTERPEFLDIGITYGLLNVIGTLAALKWFKYGDIARGLGEDPTES